MQPDDNFDPAKDWPADRFVVEIASYRSGEQEALLRIFKTFEPDLNRYYWHCFGKEEIVEEALQEFYDLMLTRLSNPKYRSINIALYKIWRKEVVRRIHRFLKRCTGGSLGDLNIIPNPGIRGEDVDPVTRTRLMECFEELKPKPRQVIFLHYFEGKPFTEITNEMEKLGKSITYDNVRQIHVRALRLLLECLKRKGEGND